MIALPANLWETVAANARLPWPPRDAADAAAFVDACGHEALLPIAFDAPPDSAAVADVLRARRALSFAFDRRVAILERTIGELPELIGEEFAVMKGVDYAFRLYDSPRLRPMADIDVVVPRHRVAAVVARLSARGFPRTFRRLFQLNPRNPDLSFNLGAISLEVHQSITHRSRLRLDEAGLWQRRVPCTIAGVELTRLSDVDAFLVSIINVAKEDLAASLIRYLDMWLMLRRDRGLVHAARERAAEWRMRNAFDLAVATLAAIFPDLDLPIAPRRLLYRLVDPAAAAVNRDRRRLSRAALLWRKHWLIDAADLRAAFLAEMAAAGAYGITHRRALTRSRVAAPTVGE